MIAIKYPFNYDQMHVKNKIRRTTTSFDFESGSSSPKENDSPPTIKMRESKFVKNSRPTNIASTNNKSETNGYLTKTSDGYLTKNSDESNRRRLVYSISPSTMTKDSQPTNVPRFTRTKSTAEEEIPIETRPFSWYWPFTEQGVAKGEFNEQKFFVRLPFKCGTNNEHDGTIMKVDKISEFNYCWTIGLSTILRNPYNGNPFWRIEIEIVRSLNTFILFVCREIWTSEKKSQSERTFKKLRRVYKLPPYYDITTLKTSCYIDSFMIEVFRRRDRNFMLRRTSTYL